MRTLEADVHGIRYARDTFTEYGIKLPRTASDTSVVKAYNSILSAAALTARPADDFFRAIRGLNDFSKQPCLDPKWNLNLNELLR